MSSISGLVDKATKSGMNAVALTDHGSMFGIKEFFNYVKKKNSFINADISDLNKLLAAEGLTEEQKTELQQKIAEKKTKLFKPIIGCETYVAKR